MKSINIFIAYSRQDTPYLTELKIHLGLVERIPNVDIWYDGEIIPGTPWEQKIKEKLYSADIILLLMSAYSLHSKFFYEIEMKKALEQHHSKKSIVIPVILSHCMWNEPELQLLNLQALPKGGKPIRSWEDESEAYDYIARGVKKSVRFVVAKRKIEADAKEKVRLEALQKEQEAKKIQELIEVEKDKYIVLLKEKAAEVERNIAAAKEKVDLEKLQKEIRIESSDKNKVLQGSTEAVLNPSIIEVSNKKLSDSFIRILIYIVSFFILLILVSYCTQNKKEFEWSSEKQIENKTELEMSDDEYIQKLIDDMILVKGGTFTMGCLSKRDEECESNELPIHKVTISDFKIGKFEVTQAQWEVIMGENPSHFKGCIACPVEQVSWENTRDFIQKLNEQTGKAFRLPTEAEWEFAARGGIQSKRYTYAGSNDLNKVAWYEDNSKDKTHIVGERQANELGLFDMSGNVWEWCTDGYDAQYYTNSSKNNSNMANDVASDFHVLRGGSWGGDYHYCRIAFRGRAMPTSQEHYFGFRLAQ